MAPDNGLVQVAAPKTAWSTKLFEMKRPLPLCLYAWCLPCCATATARSEFDDSDFIFNLLSLNPSMARSLIRSGYGIEGSPVEDIFLPCVLQPCVVAQMLEEVRKRGPMPKPAEGKQEWKTGLCEFECGQCLYSCCFMPCAIASARQKFDGDSFLLNCMCSGVALNRSIIRKGYGLEGSCVTDLLYSMFLPVCVTSQVLGETKKRGKTQNVKPANAGMH